MILRLKEVVNSTIDNTRKYIFYTVDKLVIEFSYINKNDGKDIICIPSQSFCNLGCKFCHTSDFIGIIKNRNLSSDELLFGIDYIYNDLKLNKNKRILLISVMGLGEILFNIDNLIEVFTNVKNKYDVYTRFSFATSLPKNKYNEFFRFTRLIEKNKLDVKLHLSLHYTNDILRDKWMSNSLEIKPSLLAVEMYNLITKNPVEIHYTLIDGLNDSIEDAIKLTELIKDKNFNVKFLYYNEKETLEYKHSDLIKVNNFSNLFDKNNISYEYYKPVGYDIFAGCGMLAIENYKN